MMSKSFEESIPENQEKMDRYISLQKILEVADNLLAMTEDFDSEYARGVCELVGGVMLDVLETGIGIRANAISVANMLEQRRIRS